MILSLSLDGDVIRDTLLKFSDRGKAVYGALHTT